MLANYEIHYLLLSNIQITLHCNADTCIFCKAALKQYVFGKAKYIYNDIAAFFDKLRNL